MTYLQITDPGLNPDKPPAFRLEDTDQKTLACEERFLDQGIIQTKGCGVIPLRFCVFLASANGAWFLHVKYQDDCRLACLSSDDLHGKQGFSNIEEPMTLTFASPSDKQLHRLTGNRSTFTICQ